MAAAVVLLVRLPHLGSALGIDEAGYLLVGGQWGPGGRSLYGDYFVDRPPLLLTAYQLAAALGGAVPLRILGALAAAVTVLATGHAAARAAGPRAAAAASVLAAALLADPLAGSLEVNGELLAAPFIAVAVAAGVTLAEPGARRELRAAAIAGACATAAVLVKQNMIDAAVFLAVLGLVTLRTVPRRRRRLAVGGLLLGSVSTLVVVALWTVWHGTSLRGVLFAMYPFRVEAARVLAVTPSDAPGQRTVKLVINAAASGMVLLLVVLVVGVVTAKRRRSRGPRAPELRWAVLLAALATTAYAIASVAAGGSYWTHYLVELVVPLSLGAGVVVSRWRWRGAAVVGVVVASTALGSAAAWPPATSEGEQVGQAIGAASRPGDTIVTIWGRSDVDYASGLASPYPQLWSLTTRTLDPQLALLAHTLSSPVRPTWLVVVPRIAHDAVDTRGLAAAVARHYTPVARCSQWTVYREIGASRPTPKVC